MIFFGSRVFEGTKSGHSSENIIFRSCASNSRVNKHSKLTPLQLVTGQQPVLPPKQGATERKAPYMSQTRLSHLGMHQAWRTPSGRREML